MKVFKFGGASVKDSVAVKNVAKIMDLFQNERVVIIVSAMGKTTNALEKIAALAYEEKNYEPALTDLINYHNNIITELEIELSLDNFLEQINLNLAKKNDFSFPQYYDQVVSAGELMSSVILSTYLNTAHVKNTWLDARKLIRTDDTWREGTVDWDITCKNIVSTVPALLQINHIVTQGFIGETEKQLSVTLGREGSDYTGAIFAHCLHAEALYIWKDVPGVLNADPKKFTETINIHELTYYEAIEMTYYGATVIHPKTIKPLQNKQIPLYVKSFLYPHLPGTVIHDDRVEKEYPPIVVLKENQVLFSIYTTDFSFIAEKNLSHFYEILAKNNVKANMMQSAAISISFVIDNMPYKIEKLKNDLKKEYEVRENPELSLLTIRHYTKDIIDQHTQGKEIILQQRSRNTVQILFS